MDEVVIEDDTFTEKWANILDEYLKNKLEVRVNTFNKSSTFTDLLKNIKLKYYKPT
jgi:hypothetical protein